MHFNSLIAYLEAFNKLNEREKDVYAWLLKHGEATRREVCMGMFASDNLNLVSPRITALLQKGLLVESGTKREYGRHNMIVRALTQAELLADDKDRQGEMVFIHE